MAANPLITFKAGRCDVTGRKIKAVATPGYLYLYSEDDLIHLCWRPRSAPATDPEIDLIAIPGDATFTPFVKEAGAEDVRSPTNGRVFALKFSSSGEKHYFWMQAKTQHRGGDESWFSQRDQRLGQIVDALLSGEEVNVEQEVEDIRRNQGGDGGNGGEAGDDGDEDLMELDRQESQTGGAGADATGGDPREEGQSSREGGADGGRAPQDQDASALVQNFLQSLNSSNQQQQSQQGGADKPYTTLSDLLTTSTTIPWLDTATPAQLNTLCTYLPAEIFLLAQEATTSPSSTDPDPSPAAAQAAIEALSEGQKKEILRKVLRSPQLQQSLGSLTVALRDGGLPMIGEALGLKLAEGGNVRGGRVPMGEGAAVEGFVEGFRRMAEEEKKKDGSQ